MKNVDCGEFEGKKPHPSVINSNFFCAKYCEVLGTLATAFLLKGLPLMGQTSR